MRWFGILVLAAAMAGTASAENPAGNALAFDGVDDWIDIGASPEVTAPFTLEAWVKPALASPYTQLIAGPYGADRTGCWAGAGLFMRPGTDTEPGALAFVLGLAGCGNDDVIEGPVPTLGQWYHLAGTYDGSTMRFYVDGILVGELENVDYTPFRRVVAGCGYNQNIRGPHAFFAGQIDELRFWSIVRTGTDIAECRMQPLQGDEAGLEAYWNFDEGAGQFAYEVAADTYEGRLGDTTAADAADPTWVEADWAAELDPPTAEELLEELLATVEGLDLPPQLAQKYKTKLRVALKLLQDDRPSNNKAAIVILSSFSWFAAGPGSVWIPEATASHLSDSALEIMDMLNDSADAGDADSSTGNGKSRGGKK
ncbi:MAG: LamG domain-containing protein [Planctomycetota bacterium]|jgi:hypothetical protein